MFTIEFYDSKKMVAEILTVVMRAAYGECDWDEVDSLIYEWRESALIAKSGVLDSAMFSESKESPLPNPRDLSTLSDADEMPTFVLVANGVTKNQFKEATELIARAGNKISFVPQGSGTNGSTTQGLTAYKPNPVVNQPPPEEIFNNVRYEWSTDGAEFGAELVKILAHHSRKKK